MASLSFMLRPHHVSLLKNHFSLQSLFHSFEDRVDPFYEIDGGGSLRGINSPSFNVSEIENAYLLDGEFPGLKDKKSLIVEWMENQVLIIRGTIEPGDTETMTDPFKHGLKNEIPAALEHVDTHKSMERRSLDAELEEPLFKGPKTLLRERHIGKFQRSFTFPAEVDSDHMQASLADGLLRIVVPKKLGVTMEKKRIEVK